MPTIDFKHYGLLLAYALLTALINLVFSKRSQIDEWCEANPKLAFVAKLCRGFGVDPWTILQSLVLLFTSKLPGYQKQSLAELNKSKPPSGMGPMGGMFALCFCFALTNCAGWKPVVKDIDTAAVILCDVFFSEQPNAKGLSPADVEKAFCSTAEQVAPFLDSAKKAAGRGGAIRLSKVPQ